MNVRRLDAALVMKPEAVQEAETKRHYHKLFPLGTFHRWDFPKGGLTFDVKFFEAMVANFKKNGRSLPIDYFHRGESVNDGHPTEDKVAAGWIEDLEIRGDGLWMLNTWTARARRHILADELRYLSPTFSENATDRATGKPQGPTLFGAGLLNDPFLQELPRVAASAVPPPAGKSANKGAPQMKDAICGLLGLPVETSDEEVTAKLKAHMEAKEAAKEAATTEVKAMSASRDEASRALSAAQATVKAQAAEVKTLSEKLASMETAKRDGEILALQRELVAAGKIVADSQEKVKRYALATSVDEAREFFTSLPTAVQTGETGVAGSATTGDATAQAQAKLDARIAELRKADGGLKYLDAHRLALAESPELGKALYSSATPATPAS